MSIDTSPGAGLAGIYWGYWGCWVRHGSLINFAGIRGNWTLGYCTGDDIAVWSATAAPGAFVDQDLASSNMVVVGPYLHCLRMLHPLAPHKNPVGRDFLGTFQVSACVVQLSIRELRTCCFGARYYYSPRRPSHPVYPSENKLVYNSSIQAMVHILLYIPAID